MATVTGQIKVSTTSTQVPSGTPGTATALTLQQSPGVTFSTSGTAADQVDLKYSATVTLAASTPQTFDLTTLTDVYGAAVNIKRVRSLTIVNKSTTDGQVVTFKPGASNGWTSFLAGTTPTIIIPASTAAGNAGMLVLTAPNTTALVTGSTNKTFILDPGANTISVDIEIMGASA